MSDPYNALITELEPGPRRAGPLAGLRLAVKRVPAAALAYEGEMS